MDHSETTTQVVARLDLHRIPLSLGGADTAAEEGYRMPRTLK